MRDLVIALLACMTVAADLHAQSSIGQRATARLYRQFEDTVGTYARLHHELDRTLGPIPTSADAITVQRAIESRADAIRRARPEPRQGGLFTRELAPVIRRQIAEALRTSHVTVADVLYDELAEGNEGSVAIRVNAPFPWQAAVGLPLCVNNVLPPLPEELQYRFVDRNLVLVDLVANLVVDILPNALSDVRLARR